MILPEIKFQKNNKDFFIYFAADEKYFDEYGKCLINSCLKNVPDYGIHSHLYNPTQNQIDFCVKRGVSLSYEYIEESLFEKVSVEILSEKNRDSIVSKIPYTKKRMNLKESIYNIKRTYFACSRFIRLCQIKKPEQYCLSIDVDGIVRKKFNYIFNDGKDFHLYEKSGNKKGKHLAGAILFNNTEKSNCFLNRYSEIISQNIKNDNIYWSLDQIILDKIVLNYNKGILPIDYVDWNMSEFSCIWSAKGPRKELPKFKQEQDKYK